MRPIFAALLFCFTVNGAAAQSVVSDSLVTVVVDGIERESHVFVPSSYEHGSAVPLVLSFHGTGGTPDIQRRISELEVVAERESFIVLSPRAVYTAEENWPATWNVYLDKDGVDDVKFVRSLIAAVSGHFTINEAMIYSTGFSGGGRMTSRIGCDLSDVVAAIAPVAGIQFPGACNPSAPIPIMTFHGEQDEVNHYVHNENSPAHWHMGVEAALAEWASRNGCSGSTNETVITPQVTFVEYAECPEGSPISMFRMKNGGHTWPGSTFKLRDMTTIMDISASEMMWSFFEAHSLN